MRARLLSTMLLLVGCGNSDPGAGPLQLDVRILDSCIDTPSATGCAVPPCPDGSFFSASASMEFAALAGGCPGDQELLATYASKALRSVVGKPSATPPDIGRLPGGTYGFAVFLRTADCELVGFGCTQADTRVTRQVNILAVAWDTANLCHPASVPGCPASQTCVSGACK